MTQKEPDYETAILLKLGAVDGLLKSFMSSLKEPPQKKGMSFPVYAGIDGRIRKWFPGYGDPVSWHELLCIIDSIRIPGDTRFVLSPATGTLHILAEEGETVDENTVIATVKTSSILV